MTPLAKKDFNLLYFAPHYVEVFIWETRAELNQYFDKHHKVAPDVEDGLCNAFHHPLTIKESTTSARRKVSKKLSQIHFCKEVWGIEIITHEVMHLVFHMIFGFGLSAMGCMSLEEKWCYTIGRLVEDIAKYLHSFESLVNQTDIDTEQVNSV